MKRIAVALIALIAFAAHSATQVAVTPGPWDLYKGSSIVKPRVQYVDLTACANGAKALGIVATYSCKTSATVAISIVADPLPLPPPPTTGRATYFCSCGTGAAPGCVPGADTNSSATTLAGSTGPKLTKAAFQTVFESAVAGDRLLLVRGCAWDNWALLSRAVTSSLSDYIANPLIIDSAWPTQFSSSAQPRLNTPTSGCAYNDPTCTAFTFTPTGGMGATRWGGYVIRNLHVYGGDVVATQGMSFSSSPEHIVVEGMTFDHLDGAWGCSNQAGGGSYGSPSDLTLRNSVLSYILGNGLNSWGCNNVLIEDNWLDRTANAPKTYNAKIRDHAMYVSGNGNDGANPTGDTTGVIIRRNTITNTGLNMIAGDGFPADPTRCNSTVIVGHDKIRQMVVEANTIVQAPGTAAGGCYGIGIGPGEASNVYEYEKFFTVRGNRVIGAGNVAIKTAACQDCIIENNVIVKEEFWDDFWGIQVTQMPFAIVTDNARVKIRNNSIYIHGVNDVTAGITLNGSGTGHEIVSNLIVFGPGGAGGAGTCFGTPLSAASYAAWNNNLCYGAAGWTPSYTTRALFNSATGLDAASLSSNPLLAAVPSSGNGYSMQIQTGSPAKDAGHATASAQLAIDGFPPISTRDIGAYEFGSNP